eukprot:14139999-Ditylum_brightwellii.AAC.1
MEKATSASTAIKEYDYEKLRTLMGWLPLEVVKRTLGCTTQLAMGSLIQLPFRQHHKSRTSQLNTLFSSEPGLGGVTCTQLFVGTSLKLTKVYGMKTENEGPDAFEDLSETMEHPTH